MIDQRKIIAMTKLAVYDKTHGSGDRRINEYFRHDYVYHRNAWTRFYVFLGGVILLALYWLHQAATGGVDLFALDFQKILLDAGVFLASLVIVYSLISSQKALLEYNRAQKRLEDYFDLIDELEHPNHKNTHPKARPKDRERVSYTGSEDAPDDMDIIPANVYRPRTVRRTRAYNEEEPFDDADFIDARDDH